MSVSKPLLRPELATELGELTFDQQRVALGIFIKSDRGQKLWDLITALRGPDSPSETPSMSGKEAKIAYAERRKRKYNSTEVIRWAAFFGVVGGAARYHEGDKIVVEDLDNLDHFSKHMVRAANAIGLKVKASKQLEVDGLGE